MQYHQIPTNGELPSEPPAYEESPRSSSDISIDQFEIDDPNSELFNNTNGSRFFETASSMTRTLRSGFSTKIVNPLTRLLDPVTAAWRTILIKFDVFLAKIGNPLIIKRFLYVFFISAVIYLVVSSELYPKNKALINGQFNDQTVLIDFVDSHVDKRRMEETLEYLSSIPHVAGTSGDLALARYVNNVYSKADISPKEFNEVKSFLNYPDVVELELKAGDKYKAQLMEPGGDQLPFKSFSFLTADGTVDGPVAYINYGRKMDYDVLKSKGIALDKCICFVKYGKISASSKVKIATSYHCGAVVLFKDPKYMDLNDDEVRQTIERQSSAFAEYASGDVLTPGWPSIDSNPRINWDKSETAPQIPSIPVSYEDAVHFLKALKGQGAEVDWDWGNDRADSDMGYSKAWTGGVHKNSVSAHLKVQTNKREVKPLWNIVGKISGIEQSEKAVIIAAQRDSACFGAVNPNTGTTVLLELVEIFAQLQKKISWSPLRSVYFISVDGGEYNYAGLTEWVEERFRELRKEAFAYIDIDDAVGGDVLDITASPAFESLIMDVLGQVNSPSDSQNPAKLSESVPKEKIDTPRSFSNSYPFLSFVGTPVMSFKYRDKDEPKDIYTHKNFENSCFDTFKRFTDSKIDEDMTRHTTLVKLLSRIIIRLVDDPFVPYSLRDMHTKINYYVEDLINYADKAHPNHNLNVTGLHSANEMLQQLADVFERWKSTWNDAIYTDNAGLEPSLLSVRRWEWNSRLVSLQRFSVLDSGITGRPWIKNMLYGPQVNEPEILKDDAREVPFEWWTFPSVRDALDAGDLKAAQSEIGIMCNMFEIMRLNF